MIAFRVDEIKDKRVAKKIVVSITGCFEYMGPSQAPGMEVCVVTRKLFRPIGGYGNL
jgi:hypothetical protein